MCQREPAPRVFTYRQKVRVTPDVAGTEFPPALCGCAGAVPSIAGIEAWVRRRGECTWRVKYPAWDVSERGWIVFRWDDALYGLKPGRYEAEIRQNGHACGAVELVIGPECAIDLRRHRPLTRRVSAYPTSAPEGAFPVFDAIATFSASLCGVLERGATTLPLCPADLSALCSVTLCRPVELQLSDGVATELVMFEGCVSGVPQFRRGSPQFKFPRGASLSFVWSTHNVTGAMSPCP